MQNDEHFVDGFVTDDAEDGAKIEELCLHLHVTASLCFLHAGLAASLNLRSRVYTKQLADGPARRSNWYRCTVEELHLPLHHVTATFHFLLVASLAQPPLQYLCKQLTSVKVTLPVHTKSTIQTIHLSKPKQLSVPVSLKPPALFAKQ